MNRQKKLTRPSFLSRLMTNALFWTIAKRRFGASLLLLIEPLIKRFALISSPIYPKRIREDTYYMLQALLFSMFRINISPKTVNLLNQILISNRMYIKTDLPPGFLVISPTQKCNLKCPDCYANSTPTLKSLDYQILSRIIDEAKELWDMKFCVISGGEPFIYQNHGKTILDLAQKNQDVFFLVYTNGTLIDQKLANKLAELGNITPAISVEGMREKTERRRGKGVFDQILLAMENLRSAGVPFGISITATSDNVYEILSDDFIDFFFNQQGALYAWIFHYLPIGRNPNPQYMPTAEQRIWMWQRSWELIKNKKIMIADFWNHGTVSQGCIAAGRRGGYFYIDWNGNIMPCVFFPYIAANINEIYQKGGSLADVLKTPLFQAIQQWQKEYGYNKKLNKETDWLRPCPFRDHHATARQIIQKSHPPIADGNDSTIESETYLNQMIAYNTNLAQKTKPIWTQKYIQN
ncbi:MAG: radical SAM/SPASM domain-containing protein [candidate division WOR-3 bacterium]